MLLEAYEKMVKSLIPENLERQLAKEKGTVGEGMKYLILALLVQIAVGLFMIGLQMLTGFGDVMVESRDLEALGLGALFVGIGGVGLSALIVLVAPVLTIMYHLVATAVMYLLARLLGGTGTFGNHFYQFAVVLGGLSVISALLRFAPCVGALIGLALGIYQFYLCFMIYRGVHKLGNGKAALLVLLPILLLVVLAVVAMLLFGAMIFALIAYLTSAASTAVPT